jgi:UDP-GlcNAc:undecaprenyl-phosphate GlcNAc-1-phosphate transferase
VQAAVAAVVVIGWPCAAGWLERLTAWFWIVGLTNAFNMLDNMDALSGGIAAIAAAVFALAVLVRHGPSSTAQAAPFVMLAGAVAGFLWFNRPPARVFMGDAGSTFLGFFLGVRSLDGGVVEADDWRTWLVPAGVLALPWYDLAVVVAIRLSQGRSPFHADKQHLSHRLAARGWSSAAAVRIIHLLALASSLVSLAFLELAPAGALTLALVLAGAWLAGAVFEFFSWRRGDRDAGP